MDLPNEMLVIDYNTQMYFHINEQELKESIQLGSHYYVCSPDIFYNIESSPNCVIDEIYQRVDNTTYPVLKRRIQRTTIWKQMYTKNTWLFIMPEVTRIAVTCKRLREDVTLNKTGVISID